MPIVRRSQKPGESSRATFERGELAAAAKNVRVAGPMPCGVARSVLHPVAEWIKSLKREADHDPASGGGDGAPFRGVTADCVCCTAATFRERRPGALRRRTISPRESDSGPSPEKEHGNTGDRRGRRHSNDVEIWTISRPRILLSGLCFAVAGRIKNGSVQSQASAGESAAPSPSGPQGDARSGCWQRPRARSDWKSR